MTDRFYIDAHGSDDEALRLGFEWLITRAGDEDGAGGVLVSGVRQIGSLAHAIGAEGAAALEKTRQVSADGTTLEILLYKKLPLDYEGPILALWVDDKQLLRIEELRPSAILVIPWNRADIDTWKANFAPTDLRSGTTAQAAPPLDPVAEAALRSLTESVNLSTGLSHPSDKRDAVWTFRLLSQASILVDPVSVEARAVQLGWRAKDAAELAEVAAGVRDGKRYQVGSKAFADDIVDQWRQRA
jgi:hypothetical protein